MSRVTKRTLKKNITTVKVVEILSALDIEHLVGAIDVKDENLVDVAYIVHQTANPRANKLGELVRDQKVTPFTSASDCPLPPEGQVEAIYIGEFCVCKKIN